MELVIIAVMLMMAVHSGWAREHFSYRWWNKNGTSDIRTGNIPSIQSQSADFF
jgi:hypothetical protein